MGTPNRPGDPYHFPFLCQRRAVPINGNCKMEYLSVYSVLRFTFAGTARRGHKNRTRKWKARQQILTNVLNITVHNYSNYYNNPQIKLQQLFKSYNSYNNTSFNSHK